MATDIYPPFSPQLGVFSTRDLFLYLPAYYTEAEEGLPRGNQLCNILRKMNMVMLEWESLLCTALGLELSKD